MFPIDVCSVTLPESAPGVGILGEMAGQSGWRVKVRCAWSV